MEEKKHRSSSSKKKRKHIGPNNFFHAPSQKTPLFLIREGRAPLPVHPGGRFFLFLCIPPSPSWRRRGGGTPLILKHTPKDLPCHHTTPLLPSPFPRSLLDTHNSRERKTASTYYKMGMIISFPPPDSKGGGTTRFFFQNQPTASFSRVP